jgi:hypothetical protein
MADKHQKPRAPHNHRNDAFVTGIVVAAASLISYFSVTSGNSINSHLFASVIHASRMRAKYSRS